MQTALKKHFGFEDFLPFQKEIITDLINGKDVLAVLPTGAGKSLCYQLPAMILPGITIVISPLISLMKDQVMGLAENNLPAAYLNSSLGAKEERSIKERLEKGEIKILYVAPERLTKTAFISYLKNFQISLLAIDEAHCISEWGHDFRTSYRTLGSIRELFPDAPVLALTATATEKVREDIVKELGFYNHGFYLASFNRKNLRYYVYPKTNAYSNILEYLRKNPDYSGIIYCVSRAAVDQMTASLNIDGIEALPYHAGLSNKERTENQERFIIGGAKVIVATIAFGMGIDKPNVRFVIHYDLPRNIEGYYQETGRAGRDGETSDCILFFSYADRMKHEYFINMKNSLELVRIAKDQLDSMMNFASRIACRRRSLLGYFGEKYAESNCRSCDVCFRKL